ncbi:hypothetical protein LSUE1_G007032 [Lachnellula suecica]|uniref:Uncharacterized protein n=1 Tax=Lachnellula suecica TaxID=602035 RepID=A0A8T9C2E0_9HELO|nr:hypothetical protein LSUE1_G007032 [Lachnellula suecica]
MAPSTCCGKSGQGCVWYGLISSFLIIYMLTFSPAPVKLSAPAARSLLFNAAATNPPLRTLSPVPVAHAVHDQLVAALARDPAQRTPLQPVLCALADLVQPTHAPAKRPQTVDFCRRRPILLPPRKRFCVPSCTLHTNLTFRYGCAPRQDVLDNCGHYRISLYRESVLAYVDDIQLQIRHDPIPSSLIFSSFGLLFWRYWDRPADCLLAVVLCVCFLVSLCETGPSIASFTMEHYVYTIPLGIALVVLAWVFRQRIRHTLPYIAVYLTELRKNIHIKVSAIPEEAVDIIHHGKEIDVRKMHPFPKGTWFPEKEKKEKGVSYANRNAKGLAEPAKTPEKKDKRVPSASNRNASGLVEPVTTPEKKGKKVSPGGNRNAKKGPS